jgi:hypothetical protein
MKKELTIIIVLVIILTAIYLFIPKSPKIIECQINSDCIAASCCHPDSCIPEEQKPDCKRILCSMSCEGPLDCGAGSCGCKKNKCEIIKNEN